MLTPAEIRLLYKATYGYYEGTLLEPYGGRDRAILTIYYGCGLRRNEGYHLNLSDVNFDRGILRVRKGSKAGIKIRTGLNCTCWHKKETRSYWGF